jgi:hypothetical protein
MSGPKRFSAVVDGVSFMHTTIFTVTLSSRDGSGVFVRSAL